MNKILYSLTFAFLLTLGCDNPNNTYFTYGFSMENVNNFKIELELKPDSTYKILKNNYFFDRFEGTQRPLNKSGKLSESEFNLFKNLINRNKIEKMKDAYGFDDQNIEREIVYIIRITRNGKSKFVSINANANVILSNDFLNLINHTTSFINNKIKAD